MNKYRDLGSIALFFIIMSLPLLNACSSDDDSNDDEIRIIVNGSELFDDGYDFNGDIDGDFRGNGGSESRTFVWYNNRNTADYNADITANAASTFRMVVRDADGIIVLDRALMGNSEPDSFSGVTSSGVSGVWSVTISLTFYNGEGSFSLSEDN